jgi:anthranilate phosphoribosyltransferase
MAYGKVDLSQLVCHNAMTDAQQLLEKVTAGTVLSRREAEALLEELLSGRMETPQIVRLLEAYNLRLVTVQELTGFASAMRRHALPVFRNGELRPAPLVDTCGTGGDASGTFNISTAAAIVAAAAGARVAKHGNRFASSRSGSADVLEALGVRIDHPLEHAARAIREVGIGFLFAPAAHAATRHAIPARRQIGKRTVFNLLGPLTNPAAAEAQILGVFTPDVIDLVAATLAELGVHHAYVVHGAGGLDEISLCGETRIAEVRDGSLRTFTVTPGDFGVSPAPLSALQGGSPADNAALIRRIFSGEAGPPHDIVVINAAAALAVTGVAENLHDAAKLAARSIASGAALAKLQQLQAFCQQDPAKVSK